MGLMVSNAEYPPLFALLSFAFRIMASISPKAFDVVSQDDHAPSSTFTLASFDVVSNSIPILYQVSADSPVAIWVFAGPTVSNNSCVPVNFTNTPIVAPDMSLMKALLSEPLALLTSIETYNNPVPVAVTLLVTS